MKTKLINQAYEVKINPPYTPNYKDRLVRDALKLAEGEFKDNKYAIPSTVNTKVKDGILRGSNWYFANILANKISKLSGGKIRPVNAREIQLFLKYGLIEDAKETYDDEGFADYPVNGADSNLHKYIFSQINSENWKNRFRHVDSKKPFLITGSVDVNLDDKFENGLRIDFNEFTEIYNHDALLEGGNFDENDLGLVETGLPYNLGKGNRNLYVSDNSVRGFCRGRNLNLYAWDEGLAGSNVAGRVRLVEIFSSGNDGLVSLVNKLEQEKQNKIRSLEEEAQRKIKQVRSINL